MYSTREHIELEPIIVLAAVQFERSPGSRLRFLEKNCSTLLNPPDIRDCIAFELNRSIIENWPLSQDTKPENLDALTLPRTDGKSEISKAKAEVIDYLSDRSSLCIADLLPYPAIVEIHPLCIATIKILGEEDFINQPSPESINRLRASNQGSDLFQILQSRRGMYQAEPYLTNCHFYTCLQIELGVFSPQEKHTRAEVLKNIASVALKENPNDIEIRHLSKIINLYSFSSSELHSALSEEIASCLQCNDKNLSVYLKNFKSKEIAAFEFNTALEGAFELHLKRNVYNGEKYQAQLRQSLQSLSDHLEMPECFRNVVKSSFLTALREGHLGSIIHLNSLLESENLISDELFIEEAYKTGLTSRSKFLAASVGWIEHSSFPQSFRFYFGKEYEGKEIPFSTISNEAEFINALINKVSSWGQGFSILTPSNILATLEIMHQSESSEVKELLASEHVRKNMHKFCLGLADDTCSASEKAAILQKVEALIGRKFDDIKFE